MPFTIAIISDIHFGTQPDSGPRRGEWGDVLLTRVVHRLRRYIQPDLVLVLGDLIDAPAAPEAGARLRELRAILDLLTCPWIAIPGNHDPAPDRFYEFFPKPADRVDVGPPGPPGGPGGVRVLAFCDPEEPNYNARRTDADLARMRNARSDGFTGTVIAMQHVSLYPEFLRRRLSMYYTNNDEVLRAAAIGGVDLAVGGHSHINTGIVQHGQLSCLSVDSLCEAPFGYTLVQIDGEGADRKITSRNEFLSMPAEYGLFDCHSHTHFAYCSENMHTSRSPALAKMLGLRGIAFTEHSGQLYLSEDDYWPGKFGDTNLAIARPEHSRIENYFATVDPLRSDSVMVGLEVDADYAGNLVIKPEHEARLQIKVGAVHVLREASKPVPDPAVLAGEFQVATKKLCTTGINSLAHPFRIFRRKKLASPPQLFEWLARHLKATGVAAEINYHINEPEADFFRLCVEMGVPLTFGSDAHNLYEVGEFYPHLALLRRIGVTGDPASVLLRV